MWWQARPAKWGPVAPLYFGRCWCNAGVRCWSKVGQWVLIITAGIAVPRALIHNVAQRQRGISSAPPPVFLVAWLDTIIDKKHEAQGCKPKETVPGNECPGPFRPIAHFSVLVQLLVLVYSPEQWGTRQNRKMIFAQSSNQSSIDFICRKLSRQWKQSSVDS